MAAQRRDADSTLSWMVGLIRRRRECPELGWGARTVLDAGHPAVLAHRADWDGSTVLAVHSFADERLEVRLGVDDEVEQAVDLFDSDHLTPVDATLSVALDPYGAKWFRLRRTGQRVAP